MAVAESPAQSVPDPYFAFPITQLSPQQQSNLIATVLWELEKEGVDRRTISRAAGVQNLDPFRMLPQNIDALLHWVREQHPQVLGRVAADYQEEPEALRCLLGERILKIVVTSLGGFRPPYRFFSTI